MSSAAVNVASNIARQVVKGSKSWPHKSPALTVGTFIFLMMGAVIFFTDTGRFSSFSNMVETSEQ
jgi:hypothetical protein